MYKLWNKLFGWDYIHWTNSADEGISRIHKSPDGVVWYYRYRITNCIDTIPILGIRIIWLTCKKEKYIKEDQS